MGNFTQQLLTPGSTAFVIALNSVLGLLFFTMLTVAYTELEDSIHIFVLLFLILGLTISINKFIMESNQLKKQDITSLTDENDTKKKESTRAKTD